MSLSKKTIAELRKELKIAQEQGLLEYVIDIRSIKMGKYGIMFDDPYICVKFFSTTQEPVRNKLSLYIHKNYTHIKTIRTNKFDQSIQIYYDETQID